MAGILDTLLGLFGRGGREPRVSQQTPADYFGKQANWKPVTSSNLVAVAYLQQGPRRGILAIRFGKNHVAESEYWYYEVPPEVARGLLNAPSKGKFHAAYVKWSYAFDPR